VARPLLWLLFAGSSAASLVALAGEWNWVAELFTHFRLYYLLAQGLLLIAFLNTRRYRWLAVTVVLAVPNAWYVGPYLWPLLNGSGSDIAQQGAPQLITLNLSYRNQEVARTIEYIEGVNPEVVVLSEYTPAWHGYLEPALSEWPHRVLRPRTTPFGMAIYSRAPLANVESLDLGVPGVENLHVELVDRGIDLYAIHLLPPTSPSRARGRNAQLDALARKLAQATRPRLVTGDLNLTPFSPHFELLLATSQLEDARRDQGVHVTWPALPLPLWIPIDHALADREAGVLDVRTGPAFGSDHFPLEIRLAPRG
jgi:endonuclease/exonuclease/phosphatase (EEP) superfamily protein YafD